MLPAWADVLILLALPVIVLAAVWLGDEKPDNMIVHAQEDGKPSGSSDEAGPDDVLAAA